MNPAPAAQRELDGEGSWPRHRWWLLIAIIFAAHVGFIFAFGERNPPAPRQAARAPALSLVTNRNELLELNDPTLFALPHARGFAAVAWREMPPMVFPPLRWSEPPRWLALPVEQLTGTFLHLVQTNSLARFDFGAIPGPELTSPKAGAEITPMARSVLRVVGDLAQRPLVTPIELPSRPAADLLTNSIVQLWVDAAGNVVSYTLMRSDTSAKDLDQQQADQRALELARTARFAPLPRPVTAPANPVGRLTRGTLIFEWHTVSLSQTNAPAASP